MNIRQTKVDNSKIVFFAHCKEKLKIIQNIIKQWKKATLNKIPSTTEDEIMICV